MLLVEPFFQGFTKKPITDAPRATEVLSALSCDSRAEVDEVVRKAVAAGATTPNPPQDHGFMFQHGFADLDGHQSGRCSGWMSAPRRKQMYDTRGMHSAIHQAIAAVWRIESARIVAAVARIVRDLGVAEELAQDALVAALEHWPRDGVPDNPGAWLMTSGQAPRARPPAPPPDGRRASTRTSARTWRRWRPTSCPTSSTRWTPPARTTSATTCCG